MQTDVNVNAHTYDVTYCGYCVVSIALGEFSFDNDKIIRFLERYLEKFSFVA